jgi:hypothetical protein
MARWEIRSIGAGLSGTYAENGWEPYGVESFDAVNGAVFHFRRRIPEPLRPCDGCRYRVDTGAVLFKALNRAGQERLVSAVPPDWTEIGQVDAPYRYVCHRNPATFLSNEDGVPEEYRPRADGQGCGEWEATNV